MPFPSPPALALFANAQFALAFTQQQAAAGRATYEQTASPATAPNLRQLPGAVLAGPEFVAKWGERGTNELLAQARATMPPDRPGALSEETYLGLVAYLLQANGGARERRAAHGGYRRARRLGSRRSRRRCRGGRGARRGAPAAPPEPTGVVVAGTVKNFVPVTDEMLRNPAAQRLADAAPRLQRDELQPAHASHADNVSRLQLAWTWPMRDGGTNQPAPIVHDGTMYLVNTGGVLQALDARTGRLIWEHHVGADIAPRGLALYGNKLIFQSAEEWAIRPQEARLIALDATTGEPVWNVAMPDVYATNSGPLVANGLLIQGMGTCTVYENNKCFISAYDPATGAQRWRFRTVALEGEPGGDSWGDLPDLYRAGAESWITGSYDPDLNLTYWGTTQAKPWMPASRGMKGEDVALYSSSTLALDAGTGKLAWYYSHAPGEAFDLDVVFERVLIDAGDEKWVLSVGKDGIFGSTIARAARTSITPRRFCKTSGRASIARPARRVIARTSSTRKSASGSTRVRAPRAGRTGTR